MKTFLNVIKEILAKEELFQYMPSCPYQPRKSIVSYSKISRIFVTRSYFLAMRVLMLKWLENNWGEYGDKKR